MKRFNIPFSPPDMTEAEVKEVADAILSGWITTGPRTKELEKQIAEKMIRWEYLNDIYEKSLK